MSLIEKEYALEKAENQYYLNIIDEQTKNEIIKFIKNLPSAQAEQKIIHCENCKHKHLEKDVWTCPFGLPGGPKFFCGYGSDDK